MSNKPEKVVLAYSGGLDTSIIIPWLKENYSCEVIAMVADVGQGDDIEAVIKKAYDTGASKVVVEDLREEFLRGYVFPAVQAGAVYEHKYLLGTSIARPLILVSLTVTDMLPVMPSRLALIVAGSLAAVGAALRLLLAQHAPEAAGPFRRSHQQCSKYYPLSTTHHAPLGLHRNRSHNRCC